MSNGLPKQCPSCGGFSCTKPCSYGSAESEHNKAVVTSTGKPMPEGFQEWAAYEFDLLTREQAIADVVKMLRENPELTVWSSKLFWSATDDEIVALLTEKQEGV